MDVVVVVSLGPAPTKIGATLFACAQKNSSGFNGKPMSVYLEAHLNSPNVSVKEPSFNNFRNGLNELEPPQSQENVACWIPYNIIIIYSTYSKSVYHHKCGQAWLERRLCLDKDLVAISKWD